MNSFAIHHTLYILNLYTNYYTLHTGHYTASVQVEEWLSEQQDVASPKSPKNFDSYPNRYVVASHKLLLFCIRNCNIYLVIAYQITFSSISSLRQSEEITLLYDRVIQIQ